MPELPEVETVRRGLEKLIIGKVIKYETHDFPKGFPNTPADVANFLVGAKITDVRRRAKVLLIDLNSEYTLVIHLKMTGQLVYRDERALHPHSPSRSDRLSPASGDSSTLSTYTRYASSASKPPATTASQSSSYRENEGEGLSFGAGHPNDSLIGELPDKSTRVTLEFTDGSKLFFNDQRKFGWVKLLPTIEVPNIDFMRKVGPEPLESGTTSKMFIERIRRRNNTTIKAALLDQTVIAGVGNIYADESLWGAKIHPLTRVRNITDDQLALLFDELRKVLQIAIEKGGSTDRNYVNAEGKKGSYIDFARVFRREGLPCPRCGATIEKTRVAGRGTHTCPVCQQEVKD